MSKYFPLSKQEWRALEQQLLAKLKDIKQRLWKLELTQWEFLGIFYYGFTVLYVCGIRFLFRFLPAVLGMLLSVLIVVYIVWMLLLGKKYYYRCNPAATPEVKRAKEKAFRELSAEQKQQIKQERWRQRKKWLVDFLLLRASLTDHDPFGFAAAIISLIAIYQLERIMQFCQNLNW